jgi:hypothetical protein
MTGVLASEAITDLNYHFRNIVLTMGIILAKIESSPA